MDKHRIPQWLRDRQLARKKRAADKKKDRLTTMPVTRMRAAMIILMTILFLLFSQKVMFAVKHQLMSPEKREVEILLRVIRNGTR